MFHTACATRLVALTLATLLTACASSPNYGPVPDGHYRVTSGDTLSAIARANRTSTADLVRWNRLTDPDKIEIGQVLRVIPPMDSTASGSASASNTSPATTRPSPKPAPQSAPRRPATPATAATPTAKIPMDWPASGAVIATFNGSSNKGIDIGGNAGDPVTAAAAGKVVYAGHGLRGYGNLVMLQHSNNYLTAYAHTQKILVKEGAQIAKGQKIAEMGSSDTDQIKLHFEVRQQGKPFDPLGFLPKR